MAIDPRADLVQQMLDRNRLSLRWLAEKIERPHQTIPEWLSGSQKPRKESVWTDMLSAIQAHESSVRNIGKPVQVKRSGTRVIPVYPGLSAGAMSAIDSDTIQVKIKDNGSGLDQWGRIIDGFSMYPLLEPGDVVVFEARPWEPNHVVHAYDSGEDTVKVARGRGSGVKLIPVNKDFDEIPGHTMNIKGVAIARIRKGPNGEVTTTEYAYGMRYTGD